MYGGHQSLVEFSDKCDSLFLGEVDLVGRVGASTSLVASARTSRSKAARAGAAGGLDVLGVSLVAGAAQSRLLAAGACGVLGYKRQTSISKRHGTDRSRGFDEGN